MAARDLVIATRQLVTIDRKRTKVVVRLFQPQRQLSGDWSCRFEIKGLGRQRMTGGHGVDAFQALQQACECIRLMLDESGRKLSFLGMEHHFFPRYVPQFLGPELERKLNLHIEREVTRFAKDLERRHKARWRAQGRRATSHETA